MKKKSKSKSAKARSRRGDKAPRPPSPSDEVAVATDPKAIRAGCIARFRAELESDLRNAERDVRDGPSNTGWVFNESKRAEVNAWADFLREKLAELPAEKVFPNLQS